MLRGLNCFESIYIRAIDREQQSMMENRRSRREVTDDENSAEDFTENDEKPEEFSQYNKRFLNNYNSHEEVPNPHANEIYGLPRINFMQS